MGSPARGPPLPKPPLWPQPMRMRSPVWRLLTALAVVFGTAVAFAPIPRITWEHRGEGRTVPGPGGIRREQPVLLPARTVGHPLFCWVCALGTGVWADCLHHCFWEGAQISENTRRACSWPADLVSKSGGTLDTSLSSLCPTMFGACCPGINRSKEYFEDIM